MAGADGDDVQQMLADLRRRTAEMKEMAESMRRRRVEMEETLPAQREALLGTPEQQRQRAEEAAAEARSGAHGPARAELQRRIDLGQTTWRDVMSGADEHRSAREVRDEVIGSVRGTIAELEREDADFSAEFRSVANLLDPDGAPGQWPDDAPDVQGGAQGRPAREHGGGTW